MLRRTDRIGFGRVISLLAIAPILSLMLFLAPPTYASEKALLAKALLAFTSDVSSWRCTINPTVTLKEGLYGRTKYVRPVTIYLLGKSLRGVAFERAFFIGYYDNLGDGADVCVKFNKMVGKRAKERKEKKK